MIRRFLTFLSGIILILMLCGQDTPSSRAENLLDEGKDLWSSGHYDSAYVFFRKAQAAAELTGETEVWATSTMLSGTYLSRSAKFDVAEAAFDSVVALVGKLDSLAPPIFFARKEKAYLALVKNDITGSIQLYQKLASDCEKMLEPEADSLRARCYEAYGQALYYNGEFDKALELGEKAEAIYLRMFDPDHPSLAICNNTIGIMNMYLNRYQKSITHFQRAYEIMERRHGPTHPQVLSIKTNIGVLYGELGLFWKSLKYHKEIVPYLDEMEPSAHLNGLLNMGSTLIAVGDYEEALTYFDLADDYLKQYPEMSLEVYAYLDLHLSIVNQQLGNREPALGYINRSIKRNKDSFGENNHHLITDYMQLASLLEEMGQLDDADLAYEKVFQLSKEFVGENSLRGGHALYSRGELATRKGHYQEAVVLFEKSADIYKTINNKFDLTKCYVGIAAARRELNDWDAMFAMQQKAWETLMPELPFQLLPDEQVYSFWNYHSLEELLVGQAKNLYSFYEERKDTTHLRAVLASYEAAIAIVDSQRHYYESPTSRQLRIDDQFEIFEEALSVAYELYRVTGEEDTYAKKAFALSEKCKAGNLRDHLLGVEALHFSGIPDSLVEQEQYFRQRLASLDETQFGGEADSTELAEVRGKRFDLNRGYQAFLQKLEKNYPKYFQLKYPSQAFGFEEMKDFLEPGQFVSAYFWGEKDIYVFILIKEGIGMYRLSRSKDLDESLDRWLAFVSNPPSKETDSLLALDGIFLTRFLLEGFYTATVQEGWQLLIIPDGKLGYLPFESLLSTHEFSISGPYREWPFMARQWSITYAYSCQLWTEQQQTKRGGRASYLGFAPDFQGPLMADARSKLGALAHNQEEVSQAAKLLKGKALLGNKALKANLKELGSKPKILHFATHALADEDRQMNSRLYFAADTAAGENGILHEYEIYGLSLNSPLTVLSACQTGKGQLLRGEGIMSLARAFQYAGSKRVLTTLWQADDRSGADLTTSFFKGIADGIPSGVALQQARKDWLSTSDSYHCHPYFWASYVLIGDGGEVAVGRPVAVWIWVVLGMLVFIGAIWTLKRRFG